jgi:hypothetical protein
VSRSAPLRLASFSREASWRGTALLVPELTAAVEGEARHHGKRPPPSCLAARPAPHGCHAGEALVDVGALDGLDTWIVVRSGRLPKPCRPERCEVIQVGGSGPLPKRNDLVDSPVTSVVDIFRMRFCWHNCIRARSLICHRTDTIGHERGSVREKLHERKVLQSRGFVNVDEAP